MIVSSTWLLSATAARKQNSASWRIWRSLPISMTAAAVIVIAAVLAAAVLQHRTRTPRRPDAVDYAEQEERMMRAAAQRRVKRD